MNRREFTKVCSLLGISIPLMGIQLPIAPSTTPSKFNGTVIIIGAGAAGLTAGYLLKQLGIDFRILEASDHYGGRMISTRSFADFPISLGGEWLSTDPSILQEIVNDTSTPVDVEIKSYDAAKDKTLWEGEMISLKQSGMKGEQKFVNSSWHEFFEAYIVPSVKDRIRYNTVVKSIDYTDSDSIEIMANGEALLADRVIFTAPVRMLQLDNIHFNPPLPKYQQRAIQEVKVWEGCKAFIQFSERFYPTFTQLDVKPKSAGDRMYYDAAYGQDTQQHVLGLFAVGDGSKDFIELSSEEVIRPILAELDDIFDGKASKYYVKHLFQNWSKEPFIRGTYINDQESWRTVRDLGTPLDNKVFFAGTSYTAGDNWGYVHTAAQSAKRAVTAIVEA